MSHNPPSERQTSGPILADSSALPDGLRGGAVAIGNFDGVHRGHQAVLGAALDAARRDNCPAVALTFEPHPRSFFKPDEPLFRLTPAPLKARLLLDAGFDAVIAQPFDANLAALDADAFVGTHLVDNLGARIVIAGHDFHFGRKRSGTPEYLQAAGPKNGFTVTLVDRVDGAGGERISSSRIREALGAGDIATANRLLGRPFLVEGEVVGGAKLGRTLGFPTANMRLPLETGLRHGIYAVGVALADGALRQGVASFGRRPTFDNGAPLLETFIFDFDGDLYGQQIAIAFHGWIRAEEKFDSAEALVEQMHRDSAAARDLLKAAGVAGHG